MFLHKNWKNAGKTFHGHGHNKELSHKHFRSIFDGYQVDESFFSNVTKHNIHNINNIKM